MARPLILSGLIVIAYLAFLGWDAYISNPDCRFDFGSDQIVELGQVLGNRGDCYDPSDYLRDLGVHTDEHSVRQAFSMTAEAMGIVALFAISSIWVGYALATLVQQRSRGRITSPWTRRPSLKTKALILGGALSLGIMVVFIPAAYGEIRESDTSRPTHIPDPVPPVNLEVAGRWPFFGFPFAVTAGKIDGIPYAFLGVGSSETGILIVDISAPVNPTQVGEMLIPRRGPITRRGSDLFLAENLLYVADATGLHIVDVSTPKLPKVLGSLEFLEAQHSVLRISVDGDMALMAAGSSGAYIVDVADPANPRLVGNLETPGPNGGPVDSTESVLLQGDLAEPASPRSIRTLRTPDRIFGVDIRGDHAFVAAGQAGLRVVHISNPSSPTEVGHLDAENSVVDVVVSGQHAFIVEGDEFPGPTSAKQGLRVIDISDPASPREVDRLATPGEARSIFVREGLAFVADGTEGLRVIDISNPASLREVGSRDTPASAVDLFIQGNHAYVADGDEGLRVIDISDPTSPKNAGSLKSLRSTEGVHVLGDLAFLSDSAGLRVVDTSNPSSPKPLGFIALPGRGGRSITAGGDHVFVGSGERVLRVIDISNPAFPREVGSLENLESTGGIVLHGDLAYVAYQSGLAIVRLSFPDRKLYTPGEAGHSGVEGGRIRS